MPDDYHGGDYHHGVYHAGTQRNCGIVAATTV
jgi:hypothetical protein